MFLPNAVMLHKKCTQARRCLVAVSMCWLLAIGSDQTAVYVCVVKDLRVYDFI